jgi:hypothetical protein
MAGRPQKVQTFPDHSERQRHNKEVVKVNGEQRRSNARIFLYKLPCSNEENCSKNNLNGSAAALY